MKISKRLISITGFILLLIGILVSINIGAKDIPLKDVFNSIFFYDGSVEAQLIRDVRLPRVISALLNVTSEYVSFKVKVFSKVASRGWDF